MRTSFLSLLLASAVPFVSGFGLTTSGTLWTVDTSGGLVFTIQSSNGDVTSLKYNGVECQDQTKYSQISSGLGSASCSWTQTGNSNNYIKITCTTSTLTQYYVAQYKSPNLHMATYTTAEPSVGELRFIARLSRSALPNGIAASDINGGTAIEGSDVFLVSGQTRSKFYSSIPFYKDQVHGVTGFGVGAYMVIPGTGYESSSGGPFFRDIDNQGGTQQELYFYMNSGHMQTESYRQGLHGPYALVFTSGSAPSSDIDLTFWEGLGTVSGLVTASSRGYVKGKAVDVPSAYSSDTTVAFNNSAAQYWATIGSDFNFYSPAMKPGTYSMILYKGELAVGEQSVVVSAGATVSSNIHDTSGVDTTTFIWKIGEFDGRPTGFLNADMIETMHPSDSRMHDWLRTYSLSQGIGYFPMAIFQDVGPVTVNFALASGQGGARTLVVATTSAFAGGRPIVTVNSWSSSTPPAPTEPDSRGVTRGTWRGNNQYYTYAIPSGTLSTGSTTNVLTISVASGSSGDTYLSPNFVFDAVALY
ncbi:polysaccharide lyase family 4 protein [Peniophora sp. CONT]|nr:polysaccharide lyase family 4 protein [Peniophora sp. CONT]